ncbi:hypothetical protein GS966_11095 [Rhodococcus hoagii]|nr:hypothetical protein [Prescottella equi]
MTKIDVTAAILTAVADAANDPANRDRWNTRVFDGKKPNPADALCEWATALRKVETEAERAAELEALGGTAAAQRAWEALKASKPTVDGVDSFDELPHLKKVEYATLAKGVNTVPEFKRDDLVSITGPMVDGDGNSIDPLYPRTGLKALGGVDSDGDVQVKPLDGSAPSVYVAATSLVLAPVPPAPPIKVGDYVKITGRKLTAADGWVDPKLGDAGTVTRIEARDAAIEDANGLVQYVAIASLTRAARQFSNVRDIPVGTHFERATVAGAAHPYDGGHWTKRADGGFDFGSRGETPVAGSRRYDSNGAAENARQVNRYAPFREVI